MNRPPSAFITAQDPGAPLRAELDGGGTHDWVDVEILVEGRLAERNPADVAVLRDHKTRLIDALGRARDVEVREDRNVKPGGVLVQTESGVIDAQLETQLEEIARVLGA